MITDVQAEKVELVTSDDPSEIVIGADSFFGPASRVDVELSTEARPTPGRTTSGTTVVEGTPDGLLFGIAKHALERAQRLDNSVIAWIDAGVSALAAGDPHTAAVSLRRAIDLDPINRRAILAIARALKDVGDIDSSVAYLRQLFARDPADVEARVSLSLALLGAGAAEEAFELLQSDAPLVPRFAGFFAARGAMLVARSDYRLAISNLRKAVRLRPDWVYARNVLGIAEAKSGNLKGAEQRFREAVRIAPVYAEALVNLIKVLEGAGRWAEILDLAERYWTAESAPFALGVRVGTAALQVDTPRMARDWLEGAARHTTSASERAWALNNLGVAYDRLGKAEEAARSFWESAEAEPSDIPIGNVAKMLLERGEPEATVEWLKTAEAWCAPGTSMRQALAVALMQSDRLEEAAEVAEKLIARPDADKWAFALLGTLYADGTHNYTAAVTILRQGLHRWPNDAVLWNNLSYALILAQRLDEAADNLDRLTEGQLETRETAHVLATKGLLALYRGDVGAGWKLYEQAIAIAGQPALRARIKVKRDLEMGRALQRQDAKPAEVRAYFARAAAGPKAARPYTKHAEAELRRLSEGTTD